MCRGVKLKNLRFAGHGFSHSGHHGVAHILFTGKVVTEPAAITLPVLVVTFPYLILQKLRIPLVPLSGNTFINTDEMVGSFRFSLSCPHCLHDHR